MWNEKKRSCKEDLTETRAKLDRSTSIRCLKRSIKMLLDNKMTEMSQKSTVPPPIRPWGSSLDGSSFTAGAGVDIMKQSGRCSKLVVLTFCREIVATGDFGFAGLTALKRETLLIQAGPCRFVYAAVHWNTKDTQIKVSSGEQKKTITCLKQAGLISTLFILSSEKQPNGLALIRHVLFR